jgi:hypothetical protein
MADRPGPRAWFGRKRFGWGLRPVSWQGWLITVVYLIAAYAAARLLATHHVGLFVGVLVVVTAAYIVVALSTRDDG